MAPVLICLCIPTCGWCVCVYPLALVVSMDRDAKLRRLNDFRRSKPHCSASAMSQILTDIKTNGLPDLCDRNSMRQSRDLMTSSHGAYGRIGQSMQCEDTDGNVKRIPIACPFASLTAALDECEGFRRFMKHRLQLHPTSPEAPWSIIFYSDEVTPGNPLATLNNRKFQAVYWSFLEFGVAALSHEESWFVLMTEFSTLINHSLSGGLSQAFACLIKCFFQPDGFHMSHGGITVDTGEGVTKLFAKLGVVIQDGGAHKAVWQCRGDGASKFCILCKNLFTHDSNVAQEDGTRLLRCNQIKLHDLEASTDTELRNNARYLEGMYGRLSREEFTHLQQAVGLTYAKHGVLLDRSLDDLLQITHVFMHDQMHALFVDGVVNMTVYLCFEEFVKVGQTGIYESFAEFIRNWKWPGRLHGDHLSDIFTSDRRDKHRKAQHIKCQASDMLSLMGVLALFVQTVLLPQDNAAGACHAMLSLLELAQLSMATTRIKVSPAKLLGIVHKFLEQFTTAFGFEWMTPKCHWLLHLPVTLQRFGFLLNCFALERKHRVPKRYATDLKNISKKASTSLLNEVVCHHIASMKTFDFGFDIGLIKGRAAPKATRQLILKELGLDDTGMLIRVATSARFSNLALCHQRDVVLLRDGDGFTAGRIQLFFAITDTCLCLVQPFVLRRRIPGTALALWRLHGDSNECWEITSILAAVEFCVYPDGEVGTLLPLEFA